MTFARVWRGVWWRTREPCAYLLSLSGRKAAGAARRLPGVHCVLRQPAHQGLENMNAFRVSVVSVSVRDAGSVVSLARRRAFEGNGES